MLVYQLAEEKLKKTVNELSAKLVRAYFQDDKRYISGEEILNFSPFQQINRFILFQIFQEWNVYVAKLTHPYFDFKHEEVKEALQVFQNILSGHILVEQQDFLVLCEKAVYNTLKLLLNPIETFINFFFLNKETLPIALFEKYANYFYEFDFIIVSVLDYHKKNGLHKIDKAVFLQKVTKIIELYESKTQRSVNDYRKATYQTITGVSLDDLINPAGFNETKPSTPVSTQPRINPSVVLEQPSNLSTQFESKQINITPIQPLHTKTMYQTITIESIPIHKQFQFIQKVFSGRQDLFRTTLDAINQLDTFEEAEHYLRTRIFNMPGVSSEDKVSQEFIQIIQKRYNL